MPYIIKKRNLYLKEVIKQCSVNWFSPKYKWTSDISQAKKFDLYDANKIAIDNSKILKLED